MGGVVAISPESRAHTCVPPEDIPHALAFFKLVQGENGEPERWVLSGANQEFMSLFPVSAAKAVGRSVSSLLPDIAPLIESFGRVASTDREIRFDHYSHSSRNLHEVTLVRRRCGEMAALFRADSKEDLFPDSAEGRGHTGILGEKKAIVCWAQDASNDPNEEGVLDKLERENREIGERFDLLFHGSPALMAVSSLPDRRFIDVNNSFISTLGYSRKEIVGKSAAELNLLANAREQDQVEELLRTQGQVRGFELQVRSRDGTLRDGIFSGEVVYIQGQRCFLTMLVDITQRRQFEEAMRRSEEYFRALFRESPAPILIHDSESGVIVDANPAACEMYGVSNMEELVERDLWMDPPYSFSEGRSKIRKAAREGLQQFEWYGQRASGHSFWQEVRLSPVTIDGVDRVMATTTDITARKEAEDASRRSEEHLNTLLSQTPAVIYSYEVTGDNLRLTYMSQKVRDVLGFEPAEFYAHPHLWRDRLHPEDASFMCEHLPDLSEAGEMSLEYRFANKNGEYLWLHDRQRLIKQTGETKEIIGAWWDVTDRKKAEENLQHISFHDSLTGLCNRRYLEQQMRSLDTPQQLPLSIIMADLDGLKVVNDAYGHHTGDEMLRRAAEVLRGSCRKGDIIGRWGGDEFVVILPYTGEEAAQRLARRIRENSSEIRVEDVPISMGMGLGTKSSPHQELALALKDAEDDMYRQKTTAQRSHRRRVLDALLKALAAKSHETEQHVQNMERVALQIGERLELHESEMGRLQLLIALHDIGKITIPDEILAKEGPLTPQEWSIVRRHPATGQRIALATGEFAYVAEEILAHHERWDGSGYPRGLKGEEIPLLSRIAAIADAYEVMSNGRPYKPAFSSQETMAEFRRCAGSHFDPHLTEIFLSILQEKLQA